MSESADGVTLTLDDGSEETVRYDSQRVIVRNTQCSDLRHLGTLPLNRPGAARGGPHDIVETRTTPLFPLAPALLHLLVHV